MNPHPQNTQSDGKQMRYIISKIRNGLWRLEWEDGSFTEHSTREGAEKMALLSQNNTQSVENVLKQFDLNFGGGDESGDFPSFALKCFLRTAITTAIESERNRIHKAIENIGYIRDMHVAKYRMDVLQALNPKE